MNWEAIKHIYYRVLVRKDKIEYLGNDKYKIVHHYPSGEKHWEAEYKNGQRYGKCIGWHENGQKHYEQDWQNGKPK